MKIGGGKIVFGVLLVVFGCSSFWLSDMTLRLSIVGSSTDRTLYLFGVTNDLAFLMQVVYDGDCGGVDDADKLRLFLFLSSLFLLIIWLLTILIGDTVLEAISPVLSESKGHRARRCLWTVCIWTKNVS